MSDERAPLLQLSGEGSESSTEFFGDAHSQFSRLVGTRPLNLPPGQKHTPNPQSLYSRAVKQRNSQNHTYMFTATVTNTMLLSQVVLGAALTGLGASNSSHILITVFGALNTVIAGLIAFLKSRGQPMRARMFRDDLDRVVDEIENSAVMWLGISKNAHGYDAIDTDDQVTVRSEVARLTRLYDRAVKTNTLNDPDTYSTGAPGDPHSATLRAARPGQPAPTLVPAPAPAPTPAPPAATPKAADPPASTAPAAAAAPEEHESTSPKPTETSPKQTEAPIDTPAAPSGSQNENAPQDEAKGKEKSASSDQAPKDSGVQTANGSAQPASDPDESPATAVLPRKHTEDTSKTNGDKK